MDVGDVAEQVIRAQWTHWVTGAVAFVGGLLVQALRGRRARLIWTANHTTVAMGMTGPFIGAIQVTRNNQPVRSLHVSTVDIVNDSGRDLGPVTLTITFPDQTEILHGGGGIAGDPIGAPFSPEFANEVSTVFAVAAAQRDALRVAFLQRTRQYTLPAVARRTALRFTFLVDYPTTVTPNARVTSSDIGIIVQPGRVNERHLLGVNQRLAVTIGILITLVILAALIVAISNRTALAFAAYVTGMLVAIPGIFAIKAWRKVRRWLDM